MKGFTDSKTYISGFNCSLFPRKTIIDFYLISLFSLIADMAILEDALAKSDPWV